MGNNGEVFEWLCHLVIHDVFPEWLGVVTRQGAYSWTGGNSTCHLVTLPVRVTVENFYSWTAGRLTCPCYRMVSLSVGVTADNSIG